MTFTSFVFRILACTLICCGLLPLKAISQNEILSDDDSIYKALFPPVSIITDNTAIPSINQTYQSTLHSDNTIPTTVSIDKTKAVGQIPINSGTTPTGAKTYTVPISVPKGISDHATPKLALHYNSQQGAGVEGEGWSLSGLSTISRVSGSIYYDGSPEALSVTDNKFTLDGIRLICKSKSGSKYNFQSEQGQIYVIGHLGDNSTLQYFNVYYPNGCMAVFGYQNNSTARLTYPITEFYDSFGNKIEYKYILAGNVYYISKISYADSDISFSYELKTDNTFSTYAGGLEMQSDRLLTKITTHNSEIYEINSYTLSYTTDNYKPHLTEIGYSASGTSLNPLKFYYGDGTILGEDTKCGILTKYYKTDGNANRITATTGRFNYRDADNAIAFYPNEVSQWKTTKTTITADLKPDVIESISNKYSGNETIYIYEAPDINPDLWNNIFDPIAEIKTGEGFISTLFADLTGKQEEFLIKINNIAYNTLDKVIFTVYEYSSLGVIERYTREFVLGSVQSNKKGQSWPQPKHFKVGDFDGDGKMEIMALSINALGSNSKCYIFDLEGNSIVFENKILEYAHAFLGNKNTDSQKVQNSSDKLLVADFNGDGKHELLHIDSKNAKIYQFSRLADNSWSYSHSTVNYTINRSTFSNRELYATDINGDGMSDILLSPLNDGVSSEWNAYFSMGNSSDFVLKRFSSAKKHKPDEYGGFMFFDYDHDGVADMIRFDNYGIQVYPSDRTQYDSGNISGIPISGTKTYIPSQSISRNTFSSLMWIVEGSIYRNNFKPNFIIRHLCTGMSNSLGVIEHTDYALTNDSQSGICTIGNSSTFPYIDLTESLPIIRQIKTFYNDIEVNSDIYTYESPIFHRHGLGWLGFKKIKRYSNNRHTFTQTFDPLKRGVMTMEESDFYIHKYAYSLNTADNKISSIHLDSVSSKDLLKNVTVKTHTQYDSFDNPITITTKYGNAQTIIQTNSYLNKTEPDNEYYRGILSSCTETSIRHGESYSEKTVYLNFSSVTPTEAVSYIDGNKAKHIKWTYDRWGKVTSEAVKAYESTDFLTTFYQYHPYHQLKSVTDPSGKTVSYEYNVRGELIKEKDHRGNITAHTYDPFGRIASTVMPDGTTNRTTNAWCSGQGRLYCTTSESDNAPPTVTYYDAFGREVSRSEKQFDGNVLCVDRTYDKYGRMIAVSDPYISDSGASSWHKYSYDSFDRLTSVADPSGRRSTYEYSGLLEYKTEDGIETTNCYDEAGLLKYASNSGSSVEYSYYPDGQIKSITANDCETTFQYDKFRRRAVSDAPSIGKTTYSYDNSGNLVSITDARGNVKEYSFDSFNRPTGFSFPEMSCSLTYDSTTGDLLKVSSSTGYKKEFSYDKYGRPVLIDESYETVSLKNEYQYSGASLISVIHTSSSGFSAKESYSYSNGHLQTILLDDDRIIYRRNSANRFGKSTVSSSGPLKIEYLYDNYGYRTGMHASDSDGNELVNISEEYNYDTGNVVSRTDGLRSIQEYFEYDELNRMINAGGENVEYDYLGNITLKDYVGAFEYGNSENPYMLTYSEFSHYPAPENPRRISYSSFSRPMTISEGNDNIRFTYNPYFDRIKASSGYSDGTKLSQHFLGGIYERELLSHHPPGVSEPVSRKNAATVTERLYLGGDAYTAPAVLIKSEGEEKLYHIIRDHLGSILMITDEDGNPVQELSYDAWGRLRDPDSLEPYEYVSDEPELFLRRGYCGHEHIRVFRLINMNARLYDPALGRFISPDPYVQDATLPQNYNGYAYCLNNPLRYIDRDGEFWQVIVGAVVGAYIGGIISNGGELNPLAWDYNSAGTYLGIGFGSLFGYYTVYGLVNPGTIAYSLNYASPYLNIGITTASTAGGLGAGTDWKFDFHWTTVAGGGGHVTNVKDNFETNYERDLAKTRNRYEQYAGIGIAALLVADDATVVGAMDDWLIPIALGGLAYSSVQGYDQPYRSYPDIELKRDIDIAKINSKNQDNRPAEAYELRARNSGFYPNLQDNGSLIYLNENEVWKIGESMYGINRYTSSFYEKYNVRYVPRSTGTKTQMQIKEKEMLTEYYLKHGHLPPGNRIFR